MHFMAWSLQDIAGSILETEDMGVIFQGGKSEKGHQWGNIKQKLPKRMEFCNFLKKRNYLDQINLQCALITQLLKYQQIC